VTAAGTAALATGLTGLTAAASAATVHGAAATAVKQVSYRGHTFQVPSAWPVISLAAHPQTCVRFDHSAVYLGTPGANEHCPAAGAGQVTQAILIQPAAASAARSAVDDPVTHQITATAARVKITASYGTGLAQVQQILASASLPAPVTRTPVPAKLAPSAAPRGLDAASALRNAANDVTAASSGVVSPTNLTGEGFDACTAPSSANMSAWHADSPYSAVGIYIGGPEIACSQPNLTASWVSTQAAGGWAFIPIWVGPQAAYGQLSSPASQGTAAAEGAISAAESLGIEPGATLYDDMEAYSSSDNSAVVSFVSAWTIELHRYQYESGIYSSSDSGVAELASTYANPSDAAPDVIYDALWNGDANTSDANIPSSAWAYHQRVHQFSGDLSQTYGGYTLSIDADYLNVVQPYGKAQPTATVDSAGTTYAFARASNRSLEVTDLPSGGSWSAWTNLGGTWPYDAKAISEADGDVQVFAVGTTGSLYVDTLSGGTWSGWADLGGSNQGVPAVVQDSSGAVRVFVRGGKGALWTDSLPSGGSWSGLSSIGGSWANDAAAIAETNGNVQVFTVGNAAGNLYADTLSGGAWSGWTDLGGGNQGVPAVVQDHSGTVRVFVRGAVGAIWQDSLPSGGSWSGLTSLGGTWRDNPAALVGVGGDVWVFTTGVAASYYYDQLPYGSTTWSGWQDKGGAVTGTPAVVQDHGDTIRAYARGTNGNLYELYSQPSWIIDSRVGGLY
jgi:hypothetical protein